MLVCKGTNRWWSGWRLGRVSRWNRRGPAYIPIYPPSGSAWPGSYRGPRPSSPVIARGPSFTLLFSSLFDPSSFLHLTTVPSASPLRPPTTRTLSVSVASDSLTGRFSFFLRGSRSLVSRRVVCWLSVLCWPIPLYTTRVALEAGAKGTTRQIFKYRIGSVTRLVPPRLFHPSMLFPVGLGIAVFEETYGSSNLPIHDLLLVYDGFLVPSFWIVELVRENRMEIEWERLDSREGCLGCSVGEIVLC